MTTSTVSLPSTIPQVLDILSNESALTTSQRTYLTHLVRTGIVSQAADAAGVSNECVRQWRCPSEQWYEMFRACETSIRGGLRDYSLAMAKQELEHSAALTAHRMVQTATAEDDGPRTMPTRQRARETILEAVGVIQRHPTDSEAIASAARVMAAMRAAYLATLESPHQAQDAKALAASSPPTQAVSGGEHNEQT